MNSIREYIRRLPRPVKVGASVIGVMSFAAFWTVPAAAQYWNNNYGNDTWPDNDYRYERLISHVERICSQSNRYDPDRIRGQSSQFDQFSAEGQRFNNSSLSDIDGMIDILYEVREMCRDFDDHFNDGRRPNPPRNGSSTDGRFYNDPPRYDNGQNSTTGMPANTNAGGANVDTTIDNRLNTNVYRDSTGAYYSYDQSGQRYSVNPNGSGPVNAPNTQANNPIQNPINTAGGQGRCLGGVDMVTGYRTAECYVPFREALESNNAEPYINNYY